MIPASRRGVVLACVVMALINTRNIHRSNMLMGFPYGKDFIYDEMVLTGPGEKGEANARKVVAANNEKTGPNARKPGEEGGYTMRLEQVFRFAEQEYTDSLTEFHIVGGLNPELPFTYYTDLLRGLRERFPGVHLKAFTMVELDFFTKITRKPLDWVISELREGGMGSCPGGGAEIFA